MSNFDGVEAGVDCECCGDRWYEPWEEPTSTPCIYDEDVSNGMKKTIWGIPSYIHYKDGTIKKVVEIDESKIK